jgi:hypothetical protein
MTILNKLASSLNRRDDEPNKKLATVIADKSDKNAVKELVENLNNLDKGIQHDCIKVLYEIGAFKPNLIALYAKNFVGLLDSKNNRLQWGAMIALNTITTEKPKVIYDALTKIIDAADKGSVITNDHCVNILVKLCSIKAYYDDASTLLLERLEKSPTNQLPMYAEIALPVMGNKKSSFIKLLMQRLKEIDKESKRVRLEKVIKKLQKQ